MQVGAPCTGPCRRFLHFADSGRLLRDIGRDLLPLTSLRWSMVGPMAQLSLAGRAQGEDVLCLTSMLGSPLPIR